MKAWRRATSLSGGRACMFVMASALRAQTTTGQIRGTIEDQSGGVIPGAKERSFCPWLLPFGT
jgi:hypothetical protein